MFLAILCSQNEWLELRINIGNIIIGFIVVLFLIDFMYRKRSKMKKSILSFKFTVINLLVVVALMTIILGFNRLIVLPASIIRELFKITYVSFFDMNIFLIIFLIIGLILIGLEDVKNQNKTT